MTTAESRAALERVAGGGSAELLSSSATALCSPLCVASGRVPRVIARLAAAGFETYCVRMLQLVPSQIDAMWESLIPTISRRRIDAATGSMTAGPVALLGLRRHSSDVDVTKHLIELKGSADPLVRGDDTLRSQLGAPNLLTSLIHTPDTSGDLLRELHVLMPRIEDLEGFWHAMRTGNARGQALPPDLSGADPRPPITALVVGLRLRSRLLTRLADDASEPSARTIGEISATVEHDLAAAETFDPFDPLGALASYRATFEPQTERLRRAEFPALICDAYAQLESMAAGEAFGLPVLTARLQSAGIVLDRWQRTVLSSEWVTPSPEPRKLETAVQESRR